MKELFTNVPAFKYLLFFMSGFLFSLYLNLDLKYISVIGIISLFSLIFALTNKKRNLIYFISVFASGLILGNSFQSNSISYPNKIIPDFPGIFKGRVEAIVRNNSQSIRCFIQGSISSKVIREQANSKIFLRIHKVDSFELNEGDSIIADILLKVPQSAQFLEDFDERNYAKANDAQWFGYCSSNSLAVLSKAGAFDKLVNSIRKEINFRVNLLFSPKNAGIVNALITGNKSGIDSETSQDFSFSGTAHVLAVSGLHIGIISTIIIIILSFIRIRWLKFLIFSIFLVLYILITGYQASAIRAGVMSMIIYFAYLLERRINILNILSFGVLGILIFQPSLLFSPGFQMSVGAILGIAVFYPLTNEFINKFITSENPMIIFAKQSISVSISVNLIVSPIVAYYFGFYSNISPIANLFIIPLISVATIFAIFSILLSYISIGTSLFYTFSTDYLIDISRNLTEYFAEIKYAVISTESIILITVLISVSMLYISQSSNIKVFLFRLVLSSLVFLMLLNLSTVSSEVQIFPRQNTIVLSIPQYKNKKIFLVLDRKPKQYPYLDYSLYKYIKRQDINSVILINGNKGIRLVDELNKDRKIEYFFVDLLTVNKIIKNYKLDNKIYQQISL